MSLRIVPNTFEGVGIIGRRFFQGPKEGLAQPFWKELAASNLVVLMKSLEGERDEQPKPVQLGSCYSVKDPSGFLLIYPFFIKRALRRGRSPGFHPYPTEHLFPAVPAHLPKLQPAPLFFRCSPFLLLFCME